MKFSVRLSKEDIQRLEDLADKHSTTPSGMLRDMIRTGHDRQTVSDALQELRVVAGNLVSSKSGNGADNDLVEIKRIVTLIAKAMPSVAKQV